VVTRFAWPARVPVDPAPLLASLAAGVRASATLDREDRFFPGDLAQFPHGGATLAYGAAGVIHALVVTGARYPELDEHVDWLLRGHPPAAGAVPRADGKASLAQRTVGRLVVPTRVGVLPYESTLVALITSFPTLGAALNPVLTTRG
jgi:hypothetical protein